LNNQFRISKFIGVHQLIPHHFMKIDLMKYMSDRLLEKSGKKKSPGPVITISRLYGCPAKRVAKCLSEKLAEKMVVRGHPEVQWKLITKELLEEAAKELDVDPSRIKHVFDYQEKGTVPTILDEHTNKYYKSDRLIRNTIKKVIRNIAIEGNSIIVGRGGIAITRDIPQSLHISLEAPLEWRVVRTMEKHKLSHEEAEKYAINLDKKRKQFREYFEGKGSDYTNFDITFNCMTLSVDEIVSIIIKAVELRHLI
jgi:cytidylate kinase